MDYQYRYTFSLHWAIGTLMAWPVAIYAGNMMKKYQGGVPVVPHNKFIHDFPKVEPGLYGRIVFKRWFAVTALGLGYCFARCSTNRDHMRNNLLHNRPDLKPYPAMVPKEHIEN